MSTGIRPSEKLQDYFDYIENNTELYKPDFFGFPWYVVSKETMGNSLGDYAPSKGTTHEVQQKRIADFSSKNHLLNTQYDYVFFERAKLHIRNDNAENNLFLELYQYLEQRGKKFLIFEMPEGQAHIDLKYLESTYAPITLPYEFIGHLMDEKTRQSAEELKGLFQQNVNELFDDTQPPPEYEHYHSLLRESFINNSRRVPEIIYNQTLLEHLNCKALIGTMLTQYFAGITNAYSTVEVYHSLGGAFLHWPHPHKPVEDFMRKAFPLDNSYVLKLSSPAGAPSVVSTVFHEENVIDYGIPELRTYLRRPDQSHLLREKFKLGDKKTILIAVANATEPEQISALTKRILERFDNVSILIRPHPFCDDVRRYNIDGVDVHNAVAEDKYDLMRICDVCISAPSSFLIESFSFTDNVIVYPDQHYQGRHKLEVLRRKYPFATALPLYAGEQILEIIANSVTEQNRKTVVDNTDVSECLDKLFGAIENTYPQNTTSS